MERVVSAGATERLVSAGADGIVPVGGGGALRLESAGAGAGAGVAPAGAGGVVRAVSAGAAPFLEAWFFFRLASRCSRNNRAFSSSCRWIAGDT